MSTEVMRWDRAATLADLGALTAAWLEGRIPRHPGHGPLDAETAPLVAVLARLNRAGFVTIGSQPGFRHGEYEQRAAVDVLCDGERLAAMYEWDTADDYDVAASRQAPGWWRQWRLDDGIAVSCDADRVTCEFGGQLRRGDVAAIYPGVDAAAVRAAQGAWHVALADPRWGPSERLWSDLIVLAEGVS